MKPHLQLAIYMPRDVPHELKQVLNDAGYHLNLKPVEELCHQDLSLLEQSHAQDG
jgi:hypothetical protein